MNKQEKFSFLSRLKSFRYALNGFRTVLLEEHNFRIHLAAAVLAIVLSYIFQISRMESLAILFSIAIVLGAEIINTCVEKICDLISTDPNAQIKKVKDMSAALVLLCAITALTIGILIFAPKIF